MPSPPKRKDTRTRAERIHALCWDHWPPHFTDDLAFEDGPKRSLPSKPAQRAQPHRHA